MNEFILSGFADEASSALSGQIEALKKLNMGFMELRSINGKSIIESTDEEIHSVKNRLESNNIRVSALGTYIGKIRETLAYHLKSSGIYLQA